MTFRDISRLAPPPGVMKNDPRYASARIPPFDNPLGAREGDIVSVRGWLHCVALSKEGSYNVHLTGSPHSFDQYVVIEFPDHERMADPTLRSPVQTARQFLKSQILAGKDPPREGALLGDAPYVQVTGQLFFNDAHVGDQPRPDKQGTHRASFWEIHPGLKIEFAPKPR